MTQNLPIPLSLLQPGDQGEVVQVHAQGQVRQRLLEMGFIRGALLRVEKLAPLGDPMAVSYTHLTLPTKRIV